MTSNEIDIETWKRAQNSEKKFWEAIYKKNLILPPESIDRFEKCINLAPININHNIKILDIGSGPSGGISAFISIECCKVALDPLIGEINKKQNKENRFIGIRSSGEFLPFNEKIFDVIFCINALDHTYRPLKILFESNIVLSNEGHLILMVHIVNPFIQKVHNKIVYNKFIKIVSSLPYISLPLRLILGRFFSILLLTKYDILSDSFAHPYYYTVNDIIDLLDRSNFCIEILKCIPSKWNYKTELFLVARAK